MRTFQTNVDSGMESMITSTPGRPHSADDAPHETARTRENTVLVPSLPSNRTARTVWTKEAENSERKPPTGRSEAPPTPEKLEMGKKEKSVTIDTSPQEFKKVSTGKLSSKDVSKTTVLENKEVDEQTLDNNVLTVTDTV